MAKYIIDSETLKGLGNAIRSVTGSADKFTPDQMIEEVTNILDAATFILVDKDGNEYPAVYVDSDVVFTATANDIRKGYTAVTAEGVTEGTKEIPAYHTTEGYKLVTPGSKFILPIPNGNYEYTKLQAIFCPFSNSLEDSVAAVKVAINNKVYPVESDTSEATIAVDHAGESVDFGITNDTQQLYLIRYFSYKEIY